MIGAIRATAAALASSDSSGRWGPSGGYYAGAQGGRLFADFVWGQLSANAALRDSLVPLRNRARELVASNAHATRAAASFSENVIGDEGVTYKAAVRLGDGSLDTETNRELERAFKGWSESRNASVDRSYSWPEIEALLAEAECTDGEVLLRLVRNFQNPYRFAVDVLDPDQLDVTYNVERLDNGNRVEMGVELDTWGAPVRYWLWTNHPSDGRGRGRFALPADELVHRYIRRRPKQLRGPSWFSPVMVDLSMHGGYRFAELVAARTAATKMGFFETKPDGEALEGTEEDPDGTKYVPMEASPGTFEQLPKGLEFKQWDPQHPTAAFGDFDRAVLHSIAAGLRLSYLTVSGDLSSTSYGSGRIGLLQEQAVHRWLQRRHIDRTSTPVHREFVRFALLSGQLRLPSFDDARYLAATWHAKPQPWLDPESDLATRLAKRRAGLTSLTRIAAEMGVSIDEIAEEIRRENEMFAANEITIDLSPPSRAAAPLVGDSPAQPAAPARNRALRDASRGVA